MQHKKLTVEGGETNRDFRKGQKQGDLEIWDPVDDVRCQKHYTALSWILLKTRSVYLYYGMRICKMRESMLDIQTATAGQ